MRTALILLCLTFYIGCTRSKAADIPHACAPGMSDQTCQDAIDKNKRALHHFAQVYQDMGNGMIIGSDGSMSQELGNGILITPPQPQFGQPMPALPSRQTFCQRLGNTVICN